MALQSSGAISMNDINVELGVSGTTTISLNDAEARALAEVASGTISLSDFYGKSAGINISAFYIHGPYSTTGGSFNTAAAYGTSNYGFTSGTTAYMNGAPQFNATATNVFLIGSRCRRVDSGTTTETRRGEVILTSISLTNGAANWERAIFDSSSGTSGFNASLFTHNYDADNDAVIIAILSLSDPGNSATYSSSKILIRSYSATTGTINWSNVATAVPGGIGVIAQSAFLRHGVNILQDSTYVYLIHPDFTAGNLQPGAIEKFNKSTGTHVASNKGIFQSGTSTSSPYPYGIVSAGIFGTYIGISWNLTSTGGRGQLFSKFDKSTLSLVSSVGEHRAVTSHTTNWPTTNSFSLLLSDATQATPVDSNGYMSGCGRLLLRTATTTTVNQAGVMAYKFNFNTMTYTNFWGIAIDHNAFGTYDSNWYNLLQSIGYTEGTNQECILGGMGYSVSMADVAGSPVGDVGTSILGLVFAPAPSNYIGSQKTSYVTLDVTSTVSTYPIADAFVVDVASQTNDLEFDYRGGYPILDGTSTTKVALSYIMQEESTLFGQANWAEGLYAVFDYATMPTTKVIGNFTFQKAISAAAATHQNAAWAISRSNFGGYDLTTSMNSRLSSFSESSGSTTTFSSGSSTFTTSSTTYYATTTKSFSTSF